jgi:hypothetical protein
MLTILLFVTHNIAKPLKNPIFDLKNQTLNPFNYECIS